MQNFSGSENMALPFNDGPTVDCCAIEDYSEILFEELISASRSRMKENRKGACAETPAINCKTAGALLKFLNWKQPTVLQATFEYANFKCLLTNQYKETFPTLSKVGGGVLPLFSVSHLLRSLNHCDSRDTFLNNHESRDISLENQAAGFAAKSPEEWQWNLMTQLNKRFKDQKCALMKCGDDSEKLKNLAIIKEIEIENLIRQLSSKNLLNDAMKEVCDKLVDFIRRQDARLIAVNVVASMNRSRAFSGGGLRRSLPSGEALRSMANFVRSSLKPKSFGQKNEPKTQNKNKSSDYSTTISQYFDSAICKIKSYSNHKKPSKSAKKPPASLRNTVSCTDSGWASAAEDQRMSDAMTISYVSDTLNKFSDELLEDFSAFSYLDNGPQSEVCEKSEKIHFFPGKMSAKSSCYENEDLDGRSIISSSEIDDEFARDLNEKLDVIADRLREAEQKLHYFLAQT